MKPTWESEIENRLIEYMNIQSTTGAEADFGEHVAQELENKGWTVQKQFIPGTSRFNVYATFKNSDPSDVKVLLNTHLDTVPPYFCPSQDENNIYGRGSNDAKGQLANMVSVALILSELDEDIARKIGLLFVVGEEVDHVGMEVANQLNIKPEYLIVGEPTELKFGTIQKGALKVRLRANGVAGHSGYLDSGKSAIHMLVEVLNDVMNYSWPSDDKLGDTTYNVGKIQGGQALNAWAEEAHADVFFRVTTFVEDIMKKLTDTVKGRVELEPLSYNEPVVLTSPPFEAELTQVAFNTDLPYFNYRDQLKGKYLFGPGSIRNAHSKDEFMPKEELHEGSKILIKLIKELVSDKL